MIDCSLQFTAVVILLGVGSYMDITTREIPNWLSIAVLGTVLGNFHFENLWGIIAALIFFVVALCTREIGGGDVKLVAALSVVCGLWNSFNLLFFAQVSMLIFYAGYYIFCKFNGKTAEKSLPFVPFILIGYLCANFIL